jgi:hypothetical protein
MVDAGNFSFFSQRKVINLDGLVNDFAFQDTLNNRALNEYLRKNNVSYLIIADTTGKFSYDHKDKNTYSVSFESHFYHSFSDPIKLTSDAVVAEYSWRNAEGPTKFMIWKINPASQ